MCGIAGILFKKKVDENILNKFETLVKKSQTKRGPDAFNKVKVLPNLYFFHNMLSIIDIGNATQPMQDDSGVLTFNGEIYNYKSLRYSSQIYKKHSDTEVLLKGLNTEYIDFLHKTNSMFGLAYFNKSNQILTLARDRIGIKPVYYIETESVFAFASTITPLALISRKNFNYQKVDQFYLNRAFKAPDTILDDVFELEAGSYLEFDTKNNYSKTSTKWWERDKTENLFNDENEIIETIEQLLTDSIKDRLVADVPVGLFLSGGVDSSLVAALTSKQTSNLNAFTVSFYDKRFDESKYAKLICDQFGLRYNEIKVNANDFLDNISNWIEIQDDIVADPAALLLHKLSQYANSLDYRVLLAGEGADELFAGYNSYKYFNWSKMINNQLGWIPLIEKSKKFYKKNSKKYHFLGNSLKDPKFYGTAMIFEPHLLTQLLPGSKTEDFFSVNDLKQAMDLDIKDRLPNDVLTRSDRSTSGASIELRVPFLSHQLVNYSSKIESKLFMKSKTPKYLIKKLATKYLDKEFVYRKKVGFDLPLQSWISNELSELFKDTISNSIQKDVLDINVIKRCYSLHVNNNIDHSDKLWAFLCLELSYNHLKNIH